MTENQRLKIKDFIDNNEDLINSEDIETILRRCPSSIRELVKDMLDVNDFEVSYEAYPSRDIPKKLRAIVEKIAPRGWFEFYVNKHETNTSYKFFLVRELSKPVKAAESFIQDELDKLKINYNYIKIYDDFRSGALNIIVNIDNSSIIR